MARADTAASVELARRIRGHALRMVHAAGASHIGSCLSAADILAVLYAAVLRIDPARPEAPERDRLILSKGHAAAILYAVLAERGFFPREWLARYCADGSPLAGHVTRHGVPGVDFATGSLGHGLAVACGMALGLRDAKEAAQDAPPPPHGRGSDPSDPSRARKEAAQDAPPLPHGRGSDHGSDRGARPRVFVVLSDGECDEGSTWEAALFAPHHRLDNLIAIVDYNKIQSFGSVKEVLDLEPFAAKWRACNWAVREIDGHDHAAVHAALADLPAEPGRPTLILAHTVKGKGVSFMEGQLAWHYRSPSDEQLAAALAELGAD